MPQHQPSGLEHSRESVAALILGPQTLVVESLPSVTLPDLPIDETENFPWSSDEALSEDDWEVGSEGEEKEETEETEATEAVEVAVVEVVIERIEAIVPQEISSLETNTSSQETLQKTQTSIFGTKLIRSSIAECSSKSSHVIGVMTSK